MRHRRGAGRSVVALGVGLAAVLCCAEGWAQGLGAGARLSLVNPGTPPGADSERYAGGFLRLRGSRRAALEIAVDYRSRIDLLSEERITEYPIQASLLLYPIRGSLAPYLLGGFGWYTERRQHIDDTEHVADVSRRTGFHSGIGVDLALGRRAAVYLDYRYTFVRYGGSEEERAAREPGGLPLPGTGGLQNRLRLSHQGSMVTTGLMLYF
jgi:hypothetical protein